MPQPFRLRDTFQAIENASRRVESMLRLPGEHFILELVAELLPGRIAHALESTSPQIILPLASSLQRFCPVGFFTRLGNALARFRIGVAHVPMGAVINFD